ncbi:MAG: hypothetical protein ACLR8Z_12985 [Enterococcus faecium]
MKKVYQKCLWISYITVGIAVFFFSLAVIVGTIFLWFINKDLSFNRIRQKSPILYRWVMNAVRYEGYRW